MGGARRHPTDHMIDTTGSPEFASTQYGPVGEQLVLFDRDPPPGPGTVGSAGSSGGHGDGCLSSLRAETDVFRAFVMSLWPRRSTFCGSRCGWDAVDGASQQ